jgi:hypothetical protein
MRCTRWIADSTFACDLWRRTASDPHAVSALFSRDDWTGVFAVIERERIRI